MGTWGYGILDNDTAMDVKGAFEEALEGGMSFDDATYWLLNEFEDVLKDSEDGPVFYLALAAVQIERGEIHDWLKRKALQIVDRRRGLAAWREAGKESLALHEEARKNLRKSILDAKVRTAKIPKKPLPHEGVARLPSTDANLQATRKAATTAIEAIRQRRGTIEELESIVALLTDPDEGFRMSAAQALSSAHRDSPLPQSSFSALVARMASEDHALRERAAKAVFLLQVDLNCLWEPTVRLLSDPVPKVRAAAALGIWQLRRVADASCLPPLIALLADSSAKVRENAAFALSFVAENGVFDPAALPHLLGLLSAKAANARAGAAAAIKEMASRGAVDPAALPKLIELLEDKSDLVISWASLAIREYALRGVRDAATLPALTNRLNYKHAESLVGVLKAIQALAERGLADPAALPPLERLALSTALSGYGDKEQGEWKHYTIGELARPALEKTRAALEMNAGRSRGQGIGGR